MLTGNIVFLLLGAGLACGLVAIGVALGYLRGKQLGTQVGIEIDRHAVLQMLQELGSWTTEYSGNVSQYQTRLNELSEQAKKTVPVTGKVDPNVVGLLGDIMQSNSQLQKRLEAAEKQLEKQTRQIESYLSEARTDGLTKLSNRRAFDTKMDELFNAYRKGGKSFVLAIIDIDHFKKINDTHGHPGGDEVLRQVAAVLRESLENSYMIARYGGEEFAVLMAGPLRLAADRVDATRRRLATETIKSGSKAIALTISVGLSEPKDEVIPAVMIRRADEALYAAKNIGRNRVYYHDGRQAILVGAPEVVNTRKDPG